MNLTTILPRCVLVLFLLPVFSGCTEIETQPEVQKNNPSSTGILSISTPEQSLPSTPDNQNPSPQFSQDKILVKFKKGATNTELNQVFKKVGVSLEETFEITGVSVLRVEDKNKSISEILDELRQYDHLIEYAEPDYKVGIN
jgi:hypothetical protein